MAKDTRLFARLDLDYADHPKIVALSDSAFRAHIEMILYSRKYMTDGRITKQVAKRFASESLSELLANDEDTPSLIANEDGSYQLHGYADMNETKAEIENRSRVNAENGRRGAEAKKRNAKRKAGESLSKPLSDSSGERGGEILAETETETETTTKGDSLFDTLESWKPQPKHYEYGKEINVFVKDEAEKFKAHAIRNDRQLKNPNLAFTNWLKKLAPKGHPSTTSDAEAADRLRNPWKYT